jgi:K+-sensing histidine kinase KdpD
MPHSRPDASFTEAILGFLRRAGTERSTARLVGEMFRFIGVTVSAHRVSLFLASEEGGRLRPFVSELASGIAQPGLFEEWQRLEVEQFSVVQRIRAGEDVVVVEEPAEGMPADVVEHWSLQPYLAIALRRDGSLLGLLIVEGSPEVLRRRLSQIAEFAEYIAMALANARAFEREQRRASEAEALLEVGEVLTRTIELTPVLASVAQNCAKVSNFDRCSVFLLDDEGNLVPTMSQFADGHIDEEAWELFISAEHDLPAAHEVLRTGEPLAFDDTDAFTDLAPRWWTDLFGIRSVLFLPLTAWGERFGVLALDRSRPHRIGAQQVRVAQGMASQGAVAIGLTRSLARERAAVARLRELDDLKTTFVAAVSHELRTPLTTIIGFGSLLGDYVDHPEARDYVALIQRESAHLETLIANLLLATRLEAGVLDMRRDVVDVAEVLDESTDLIRRLIPNREYRVTATAGMTMQEADAGCLRQVFINLIQNAAKYSPDGSPIDVSATVDDGAITVEVIDRGPGVDPSEREAVFKRFRRGIDQNVQGTGIGLYLVRELVEGHGGRVWVDDGPDGVGARFVTVLPVRASAAVAARPAA